VQFFCQRGCYLSHDCTVPFLAPIAVWNLPFSLSLPFSISPYQGIYLCSPISKHVLVRRLALHAVICRTYSRSRLYTPQFSALSRPSLGLHLPPTFCSWVVEGFVSMRRLIRVAVASAAAAPPPLPLVPRPRSQFEARHLTKPPPPLTLSPSN
jgi:hypothetical protein